jgi:LPPG:FO 2-phospho-L-lactate transferase
MKVVALAGGVGGAKLVDGLARILGSDELTVVVNTGDDFTHFGLHISPDLDTVCYTLAHLANNKTGWGMRNETWSALESAKRLGGPGWFFLGDQDLGTHLERTRRLIEGETLTSITQSFCKTWGIKHAIYPMCDQTVATMINTREYGWLTFQNYFVNKKCLPRVLGFKFKGIQKSKINENLSQKIRESELVIICPSNPWVSIDPILQVRGIGKLLEGKQMIAVSPIIGNQTVKGPAAKMFAEMGFEPNSLSVAKHYQGLIHSIVIDEKDEGLIPGISRCGIISYLTDIYMKSPKDRIRLAKFVLMSTNIVGNN